MSAPKMSDLTTHGIRVGATAFFLPHESIPDEGRYLFGYRILIVNQSSQRVQLLSRCWLIIDADGKREHVHGSGVVGLTPQLMPQEAFKYASYCPLGTPWGTMEGTYQMLGEDGDNFDVSIGRFWLTMDSRDQASQ